MEEQQILVRPVDEAPWLDVERVFGTRGDPAGCWCQFFTLTDVTLEELGGAACAALLLGQVRNA